MNRKALLPVFVSLGVFVVLFAAVALYLSYANNQKVDAVQSTAAVTSVTGISELKVTSADIPVSRQVVGGDLKVTGNVTIVDGLSSSSLRLTPVANTSTVQAGQLYSAADNSLYYYDGRTTTNITSINGVRSDVAQLRVDTARLLSKPEGVVTLQGVHRD